MNRRGFLAGLLAAPAVITTPGLLMPVRSWVPTFYGDGIRDDTEAVQAALDGLPFKNASEYGGPQISVMSDGTIMFGCANIRLTDSINLSGGTKMDGGKWDGRLFHRAMFNIQGNRWNA